MQSYALTIDKFLSHAARWHGDSGVVSSGSSGEAVFTSYAALYERANRLSGALHRIGIAPGERLATLAWNTRHHLEVYYGSMGAGFVCHTLNPRLTVAQLERMVNEAQDRVLAVAPDLLQIVAELVPRCPELRHIIVLDGGSARSDLSQARPAEVWTLEDLIEAHGAPMPWGAFDEESAAGLCYTSGTTGAPKGVLYTHRSNYLHTLRALQADAFALTAADSVLTVVPMFHANAWGFPFAVPAVGARLILPGRRTDGAALAALIRDQEVTIAAGVPTVWQGLLDQLDATGDDVPTLERVLIGGSTCPDALIKRMEDRFHARVQTSWGMTELSPLGTIAPARGRERGNASGRPLVGLDLKLTDAAGATLHPQRNVTGHLKVKGASVVDSYYKAPENVLDAEGYFDTGDLASIDDDGYLTICGRSKDLIKSGGEWINPAEMETIVGRLESVSQVAIIGRPDPKWGERPLLIVELRKGLAMDESAIVDALRGEVPGWWIPDQVIRVDNMPLAATGKIDKNKLREQLGIDRESHAANV